MWMYDSRHSNNNYVTSINASQQCTCTVESHNYASPHLLCMLALGKTGEGAYSCYLLVTTITDRQMPHGHAISALSLAVWWAKLEKSDKISHNMTQIASVLAVATAFIGLISRQRRGAYTRDENTCMYAGTWAKSAGGGHNCGILR